MAKAEIIEKNMMVALCWKTSPLYSRCIRLSVVFLGMLTDISICGLFFNLEPIEDSFQFWENLSENLWVALYSVLAPNIPKHSSLIVELNSINIFKNK